MLYQKLAVHVIVLRYRTAAVHQHDFCGQEGLSLTQAIQTDKLCSALLHVGATPATAIFN